MIDDNDEMITRIADALRPLPSVDAAAKARVLVAVAAEREREREMAVRRDSRRHIGLWVIRGTGLVAAAAVGALMLRAPSPSVPRQAGLTASASTSAPRTRPPESSTRLAASDAAAPEMAVQSVQLVFKSPAATEVRVVGDFNGWDRERAPMVRDAETGLWSVTLSLRPGRHVYAFVVDDTLWMRDPRAPAAKDTDFGRPGSVLLVGRP